MTETCIGCGRDAVDGCNGRGFVVREDGGAGTASRCPQAEAAAGDELLRRAGVPRRYRGKTVSSFDVAGHQRLVEARDMTAAYVEAFERSGTTRGLLYHGDPGTGKTHLAAAALQAIVRRQRCRAVFENFTGLAARIQATFDDDQVTKDGVLRPVRDAELLVLDELGARRPTEWAMDVLYLIINDRYVEGKPVLFTTNYPIVDPSAPVAVAGDRAPRGGRAVKTRPSLSDRVGDLIVSRIWEMCEVVSLQGAPDYRVPARAISD